MFFNMGVQTLDPLDFTQKHKKWHKYNALSLSLSLSLSLCVCLSQTHSLSLSLEWA